MTQTFVNTAYGIHRLTTMSESGNVQTFGVTASHPYFVLFQDDPSYDQNLWSRAVRFEDEYGSDSENIDIFNDTSGCYIAACDLRPGDQLIGPSGELSTIHYNSYEPHPEGISTYNFEVEYAHNYFVLAQNDLNSGVPPVLVHNMCAKKGHSGQHEFMRSKSGQSGKQAANNVPSYAEGKFPIKGESRKEYAQRVMEEEFGADWRELFQRLGKKITGSNSEFNKIMKYFRHFE